MTLTDELRCLLDELEIEWWNETDPEPQRETVADIGDEIAIYHENVGSMGYSTHNKHDLTPKQAIAATVGVGTCKDLGGTGADGEDVFNCSECGCVLSLYDGQGVNTLCTSFIYDYPRFCPECGRRVAE